MKFNRTNSITTKFLNFCSVREQKQTALFKRQQVLLTKMVPYSPVMHFKIFKCILCFLLVSRCIFTPPGEVTQSNQGYKNTREPTKTFNAFKLLSGKVVFQPQGKEKEKEEREIKEIVEGNKRRQR